MHSKTTTTDRDEKLAQQVIQMLDRWSDRLDGHQSQKREAPRRKYHARITVFVPETDGVAGECAEASSFDVWSRNLSQSGMSFVYRGMIKADKIVICLDPDQGGTHWYQALIVRRRQVHNDFWEYGVKFTGVAQI